MASLLEQLPNEILTQILSCFATESLLPLLTVSQSFHTLVLRILHYRILYTWPLPSHGLILEAYHPSSKWTEPYLFCSYLGTTGGLSKAISYDKSYVDCADYAERCARLKGVYSRFRPHRRDDELTRRLPIMGTLSEDDSSISSDDASAAEPRGADVRDEKVEHVVNLDSDELFSQICLNSSLVKLGPVSGVFPSVSEAAGGVIRVWRHWLREQAKRTKRLDDGALDLESEDCSLQNILWVDWRHDVGLSVRVRERLPSGSDQAPILEEVANDDERPVSYAIEIRELVIRTSHLLLAIERALDEQKFTSVHTFLPYAYVTQQGSTPIIVESNKIDVSHSEKYELDTSAVAVAAALLYGKPVYREKEVQAVESVAVVGEARA